MDHTEAQALMEKRREAWLGQDLDTYLSLFSEDFFFSNGVEESRGRTSWEQMVRRNYERFAPMDWEIHQMAVDGASILAEWTATIEPAGTDARVSVRGMSISETRDGVFTSHREYLWPSG
jgi:limonene-1,2-epoxide hydrolase